MPLTSRLPSAAGSTGPMSRSRAHPSTRAPSRAGQLFVPIVAGRDGHEFVEAAMAAGAAAYLTARDSLGGTAVVVDDTGRALLDAGRLARTRLAGPVVGITGSVGKTSAKDLLAAVLRRRLRTTASERSFNNELGVPLTLLNAPDDAEVAVIEMGARGPGHIAALCSVAHPTIGLVTRIAPSHTEAFGSIEGIARAKGELVEALPADGTAVLNAFDERVAAMAARTRPGCSPSVSAATSPPRTSPSMVTSTPGSGSARRTVRPTWP